MKRLFRQIISLLALPALAACGDDIADTQPDFIGDSIIARWDIAESFPSRRVHNYGKSGAGIDYIESYAGRFEGREVAVMIGTNDHTLMTESGRAGYVRRYVDAILGLKADRVYLYSVLPRDFTNDRPEANDNIREFNRMIRSEMAEEPSVTYLDVYNDFLDDDGTINPQLYNDGLHLSPYGYEVLTYSLNKAL